MKYTITLLFCFIFLNIYSQSLLDQLVGHWSCEAFGGVLHTTWEKNEDGTFTGKGLLIENKDTTYTEDLVYFKLGYRWMLAAAPGGFSPYIFENVTSTENEMSFENLNHELPSKIWYSLEEDGTFYRKTEGLNNDGSPAINEYFFKKHKSGN